MIQAGEKLRLPIPADLPPWTLGLMTSRDKPYIFVTQVLGVLPFGVENPMKLPQLEAWQSEVLIAIGDGKKRISVRSGHGVGKGALLAWITLWGLATHNEIKIPVAANTQDQLKHNNWAEISKWHQRLPDDLRDQIIIETEKVYKKSYNLAAFAMARTANKSTPEALAGIHSEMVIFLIDEASGIPEIVFETAMGALSTAGAICILFSNPTKRTGFFYDTHHKLRGDWYTIRVNCEDVPRAIHHIQDVIKTYGKDSNKYRVRVLGEFPLKDDDVVIALEYLEAAVNRQVAGFDVFPVWGVDVGRHGKDSSALAKRRGNHLLEKIKEWRNLEGDQVAAKIIREFDDTPVDLQPAFICVDVIGIGASVYDHLKNAKLKNCKVLAINVAESASDDDVCHRLRDSLWWKGRTWFMAKTCFIPNDEDLIAELSNPVYDHTGAGKVIIESKDDMKTRTGMPSPNRADAFLNTFAARDLPKSPLVDRHRRALARANDGTSAMAA